MFNVIRSAIGAFGICAYIQSLIAESGGKHWTASRCAGDYIGENVDNVNTLISLCDELSELTEGHIKCDFRMKLRKKPRMVLAIVDNPPGISPVLNRLNRLRDEEACACSYNEKAPYFLLDNITMLAWSDDLKEMRARLHYLLTLAFLLQHLRMTRPFNWVSHGYAYYVAAKDKYGEIFIPRDKLLHLCNAWDEEVAPSLKTFLPLDIAEFDERRECGTTNNEMAHCLIAYLLDEAERSPNKGNAIRASITQTMKNTARIRPSLENALSMPLEEIEMHFKTWCRNLYQKSCS